MRDDEDRDLTAEERAALASLAREARAPEELEERVVGALRDQGLIRPAAGRRRVAAMAAALAASLILALALGIGIGARWASGATAGGEADFALFVLDPVEPTTEIDVPEAVAAAAAWANQLADAGVLVGAEKLRDEGRRIEPRVGEPILVADFPPVGDELVLGGLFLIRAGSLAEAQRIASECPLLRFGSTIEIRAFERVSR